MAKKKKSKSSATAVASPEAQNGRPVHVNGSQEEALVSDEASPAPAANGRRKPAEFPQGAWESRIQAQEKQLRLVKADMAALQSKHDQLTVEKADWQQRNLRLMEDLEGQVGICESLRWQRNVCFGFCLATTAVAIALLQSRVSAARLGA